MFKDFKPEIPPDRARLAKGGKLFLLVALIAVVISVVGILLLKTMQSPPTVQTPPPAPSPQPQPSEASDFTLSEVEGWQTYRNAEFGFEFQHPNGWKIEEYTPGALQLIGMLPLTSERLPYIGISSYDRTVAGISYCEAYPEHKGRCERFIAENASGVIEWFEDYPTHATALIDLSNYITLAVSLGDLGQFYEIPDKIKEFFRAFLATFRFVDEKVVVTSPHKGEIWEVGKTHEIRWSPSNPNERVVLQLKRSPFLSLDLVWEPSNAVQNTGIYEFTSFEWLEPGVYKFFISAYGGNDETSYNYKGSSDEFSIIQK